MILNLISWVIFGLIVGAIAKFLLPGNDSNSWLGSIVLGVLGSFVGGFLANLLFGSKGENAVRYGGWIMSIIGAMILLYIKRTFF